MPAYGIQAAPFSKQIHVGKLNKAQDMFLDSPSNPREDCTDHAIHAVGEFARKHYGGSMSVDFDEMTVTVTATPKDKP